MNIALMMQKGVDVAGGSTFPFSQLQSIFNDLAHLNEASGAAAPDATIAVAANARKNLIKTAPTAAEFIDTLEQKKTYSLRRSLTQSR